MANRIIAGVVAGAAGTVALNIAAYLDMLARGRPPSKLPAQLALKIADEVGLPLDFDLGGELTETDEQSAVDNRTEALGALLGYASGLGIGTAYGILRLVVPRPPAWLAGAAMGSLAMAAADYPAARLALTDPRSWSGADWMADVVPQMVYGVTTALVFEQIRK